MLLHMVSSTNAGLRNAMPNLTQRLEASTVAGKADTSMQQALLSGDQM